MKVLLMIFGALLLVSAWQPQTGGQVCWRTSTFDCAYCPGEVNYICAPDPNGPYKTCTTELEYCGEDAACLQATTTTSMRCPGNN